MQALIGHSLGGKVVMTMAEQFSARATSLPRPVQVQPQLSLHVSVSHAPHEDLQKSRRS